MGFTESKKYILVRLSIQKTLAAAMIFRITFLSSSRVTCEFRISTTFISYKGPLKFMFIRNVYSHVFFAT